jgi:hypothetical protein
MQLNQQTYEQLLHAKPSAKSEGTAQWYAITYQLFRSSQLVSMDDFWRLVAYTYSWMPTIPKVHPEKIHDTSALLAQLKLLKEGDTAQLEPLLYQLVPVINNSLTGSSKLLHFIAPEHVPIIDSNVLSGWDVFFFQLYPNKEVKKLPNYKTALNQKHISKYMTYRHTLLEWKANCEPWVTLRHLEIAIFDLGKELTPESFRIYSQLQ